jgi:3-hydroxybutyryl-CoA dehydratase
LFARLKRLSTQVVDAADRSLEDFRVGEVVVTNGRTIEISDILTFAGLTGDHYPLHIDEHYARQTSFKGRIAHGPLTFGMAVGLVALSGFYGSAITALLRCDDLRALHPVRPGDTIRVRATVAEVDISRPNSHHGTLTVDYSVINQDEREVMTFRWVMLARRRTAVAASSEGSPKADRGPDRGARRPAPNTPGD